MIIETALYQILKGSQPINAITQGRILSGVIPQQNKDGSPYNGYPVIVYRPPPTGDRKVVRVLEGGCALVEQPLQIFSGATTNYGAAARLDDAIFHALDEFRGYVSDPTRSPVETLKIEAVLSTNLSHAYGYVDELKVHQFVTEYLFHYIDPMRGVPKY